MALNVWSPCLHLPRTWIDYRPAPPHLAGVLFIKGKKYGDYTWCALQIGGNPIRQEEPDGRSRLTAVEVQSPRESSREQPASATHTCSAAYTHRTHTHMHVHTQMLNPVPQSSDYRDTLLLELWGPGEAGGLPGGGSRFLGLDGGDPGDTLLKTQNSRWEGWPDFWS